MAGNIQADNNGNIYVEFDYNNIILVDPNRTINNDGKVYERLVDHENLIMYANLEADVLPRTKLLVGAIPGTNVRQTVSIAKINFLRPGENNYFGTGYYDELTGKNALQSQATNQPLNKVNLGQSGSKGYTSATVVDQENVVDNGLLGITSISVKVSSSFIPTVSVELEDVQGKALFQLGNNSPYAAFFNLPYPQFYLTLKGYYGQAIRYQLNLEKFNARFNSASGNYTVSLEFKGFKFNVLNEISISHLIATPHMYSRRFNINTSNVSSNTSTTNQNLQQQSSNVQANNLNTDASKASTSTSASYVSEKGYQKIVEVYSEYKSKGLIPPDFPELTMMQLINKFDTFQQEIVNSYPKVNVEPLTNVRNYLKTVTELQTAVFGTNNSWSFKYLDPKPIVLDDNTRVYFFKSNLFNNLTQEEVAKTELQGIFTKYLSVLTENPTLGVGQPSEIKLNNLGYDMLLASFNIANVNLLKTAQQFLGVVAPTSGQTQQVKQQIELKLIQRDEKVNGVPKKTSPPLFIFEGKNRFIQTMNQITTEANKKLQEFEAAITQDLKNRIQSQSLGIGFNPTARNIIAVIMANAEGFLRLLDEVHTNAWNVKNDPVRKQVIQNNVSSAPNIEVRKNAKIAGNAATLNQGLVTAEEPVYPWPSFFIESPDDKKGRFQLTYIGDPSVVDLTQGYLSQSWPEVEFVEEYMKGLNQKFSVPTSQSPIESQRTTPLVSINAIEFPQTNVPFANKEVLKFLYEIWERQFVTSHYSNFIRGTANQQNQIVNLNKAADTNNIVVSVGPNAPFLAFDLKNTPYTSTNFISYLRQYSNEGTGKSWQDFIRDFFITPYIKAEVETPFSILGTDELGLEPQVNVNKGELLQLAKEAPNDPLIIDTYPFRDYTWNAINLANSDVSQSQQVYNTNRSLKVFTDRNQLSNFENIYDYTTNRPVTNFSYLNVTQPNFLVQPLETTQVTLNDFYTRRTPNEFIPTEGFSLYSSPSGAMPARKSTSILNTPYFVNAIQQGVESDRTGSTYPYVTAAYLFLNSLPLGTLREKYKTNGQATELDYIASVFNKFGAIHKMPYAWVLKLGSVWHRYKKYVDDNVDILDSVWRNFDYINNYDPITNNVSKQYDVQLKDTSNKITIQLQAQNTQQIRIQPGFYPKLVNDFNYFYNGSNLYKNYTSSEIQSSINDGMLLYQFPNSNFNTSQNNVSLALATWSVLIPKNINDSFTTPNVCVPSAKARLDDDYYVIPSFGVNLNQTKFECLNKDTQANTVVNLTFNPSMYNGSVRTLWSAPNYGYFNSDEIKKPLYNEYMTHIPPNLSVSPMLLNSISGYSKIEEIFAVFDAKTLNLMEQEFLNYCKPITNVSYRINQSTIDSTLIQMDSNFRNFQSFMRSTMTVFPTVVTGNTENKVKVLFQDTITKQFGNFNSQIKGFMEYDVILRNGNPSNYSRRIFDSYVSYQNTVQRVVSPIAFTPYVTNSVPTMGGNVTLAQSRQRYPNEWRALEKEVGFSTIQQLRYKDSGSYITDFFPDNNLGFTVENIVLCSKLIKMYATQKLLNPSLNASTFKGQLNTYLNGLNTYQDLLLNQVIAGFKAGLPNVSQPTEATINSQIQSMQGKVETYEVFKTLNDKWVAGSDFKTKTLFEDILFLDRASRNIGDTIILDIFDIKNMLNKNYLNEGMSVYTLISGILMKNNFTVMPLPAYVNFYNAQDVDGLTVANPEGSLEFADNLWGTFRTVDYRKSGPKMVCFYVGKPSGHLNLPNIVSGYGDDSFEFRRSSEVPLLEDQLGKTDYAISNKCVGFNVDIGIRNQNIFSSFSVGQDNGKATSESIQSVLEMANQTNTRTVGNQNASLYNYYKGRSYTCSVTALGNALIQPTMYFNLRHVPMFNGPYMITSVSHTISAGNFITEFEGVRQGVYDLPPIDNFIQSINQNLLTQIEALVVNKTDQPTTQGTTTQSIANNVVQDADENTLAAQNSCSNNLDSSYISWVTTGVSETSISQLDFAAAIKASAPNNVTLQTVIYMISYVRAYSKSLSDTGRFSSWDHNYGLITLDKDNYSQTENFIQNSFFCVNTKTLGGIKQLPAARFRSLDSYLTFMRNVIGSRINEIQDQGGILKYYVTSFPVDSMSSEEYEKDKQRYEKNFGALFKAAGLSAAQNGLRGAVVVEEQQKPQEPQSQGNTPAPTPTCPPTTVSSYSPTTASTGTIITINGTNLEFVREIKVANQPVDIRSIQLIGTTKIKFSVPTLSGGVPGGQYNITLESYNNTSPIILTPPLTYA
jgi:hypothetical protein